MYQPPNRADQFRYWARTGLVLVFFFGALLDPECPPVMVLSAPVHINILGLQKPKGPFRCNKVSSMGWMGHLPEALALSSPCLTDSLCVSLPLARAIMRTRPDTGRRPETVDSGFDGALLSVSCSHERTGGATRTKVRLCVPFVLKGGERGERKSQGRSVFVCHSPPPTLWCDLQPPLHSNSPTQWFGDPTFVDKLAMMQPHSKLSHKCIFCVKSVFVTLNYQAYICPLSLSWLSLNHRNQKISVSAGKTDGRFIVFNTPWSVGFLGRFRLFTASLTAGLNVEMTEYIVREK